MPNGGKPIVILLADDDEEDRMLAKDALAESRVVNDLRCVEDGDELLDYLYRRKKYEGETAPTPGQPDKDPMVIPLRAHLARMAAAIDLIAPAGQ